MKKLNYRNFLSKYAIYVVLLALIVIFSVSSNTFFSETNLFNILRQVSVIGVVAVGMTMVILTGGIDLSVGSVIAVSGVMTAKLMVSGVNPFLAIVITLLVSTLFGLTNAIFVHEFKINPLIVTLGMLTVLKGVSYIITKGLPVFGFPDYFSVIGQGYIGIIPIPVIIMVVVFLVGHFILKYTVFGTYIYGIGGNEEATRLAGVNIRKTKYAVYMLNSVLAALAGIVLLSRVNTALPNAGQSYELDVITGVVLGGVSMSGGEGKISGVFAGILVMAVLGNGMLMMGVSEYYQWVVKGVVMLLAVTYDSIIKKGK